MPISYLVLSAWFMFAPSAGLAQGQQKDVVGENKLIGTWKLVSSKYAGVDTPIAEGATLIKHITPTHFMWAHCEKQGKVVVATGGSYTLKGDDYQETPEYSTARGFDAYKNKPVTFKCRIEKNKWYHTGNVTAGMKVVTVEEVWERLEKR